MSVVSYRPARYPRPETTAIYATRQQPTHLRRRASIEHFDGMTFRHGHASERFLMPKLVDRNSKSARGDWYFDTHCIDCAASREVAPGLVIHRHGKSVFGRPTRE